MITSYKYFTVGVSLVVQGISVPNNSLVDVDDILYTENGDVEPSNSAHHYEALLCVTDLVDCCQASSLGTWYFPSGTIVQNVGSHTFRSNRGQNELKGGHQFYGSVRLFLRYSNQIRGRFRCELPDTNNVPQTLYANIGENSYIRFST